MAMKIYSYPGITAGDIMVKAGKAFVRVPFSGGYLNSKMKRPATFSTNNEVLQQVIENSDLFGRRISLYRSYGPAKVVEDNGDAVLAPVEKEESNTPVADDKRGDPVTYPEVRSFADAVLAPVEKEESNTPVADDKRGDPVTYPEVRSFADAVGVLKNIPGVKASQIRTIAGAKKVAAANGVLFPNYTFEE